MLTSLPEHFNVDKLSNYGQFRGTRLSRLIYVGLDGVKESIHLEGLMVFYRQIAFENKEECIISYGLITPVSNITDDVGKLSFWVDDSVVRCQMNLVAPQKAFDDIYTTLRTLKDNYLYNFFIETNMEKL